MDHRLFKTLNSRCEDIKVAVELSGQKQKGSEIETDDKGDIALYCYIASKLRSHSKIFFDGIYTRPELMCK